MKNKFGFILVKTQLGENIGACARSMKNFGFSKLHIVSPKINFPNHKTKATSVGAYDIINKAKVFDNVEKAIEPFNLVIALSARRRDINKRHISLQNFQNIIKKKTKSKYWIYVWSRSFRFIKSRFIIFKLYNANTNLTKI